MAKGSKILIDGEPKGKFIEGFIKTGQTPEPGTQMMIDPAAADPVGGRHTWSVASATARGPVAILLEDYLQGKSVDDAYAAGDRCFLYCPLPGEELNVRLTDTAGTGTNIVHTAGATLISGASGTFGAGATPLTDPFVLMEDIDEATNLAWVMKK